MKTTNDLFQEAIDKVPYWQAYQIKDSEDYVHFHKLGKAHINNWTKPNVNFQQLQEFIQRLKTSHIDFLSGEHTVNMILFFELLADNPSFAHKASKELKRLQ